MFLNHFDIVGTLCDMHVYAILDHSIRNRSIEKNIFNLNCSPNVSNIFCREIFHKKKKKSENIMHVHRREKYTEKCANTFITNLHHN